MKKLLLASCIAFAFSSPAYSALSLQDEIDPEEEFGDEFDDEFGDFYGGEAFVSIATGTKKSLDKAPAIASVITAEQIELMGASYLDEVLELVPGLHVSPSTSSRLDPVYGIRGIQTTFNPQILVLLNGTEFKNSFSGGLPYTFRLPAKNIERVEVIRGPGSALYGADAFSGVVNIVTKKHHETNSLSVGGRVGSFSGRDAWLHMGTQLGEVKLGLAIESQSSDGDEDRIATTDLQTVFDNIFGTSVSLAPGALDTNYDNLDLHATAAYGNWTWETWWWQQSDGGIGPGGAQALDPRGYQNVDELRSKLSYNLTVSDDLIFEAEASYLDVANDSYFVLFPSGSVLPIGSDGNINFADIAGFVNFTDGYIGNPKSDHEDTRLESSFSYAGVANHDITVGLGWFKQELSAQEFKNFGPGIIDGTQAVVSGELTDVSGTPFVFVPNTSRTNRHLFVQDIWKFSKDWELTVGLRYDDFSDFGSTTNPRVALVWEAAHDVTVKALYGSAFRAPSFNEQFSQNNPSTLGNPDLKPETIDTYELGINYQINFNTKLSFNLYSYEAKDLIARAPVPGTTSSQSQNLSTLEGDGAEIEFAYKTDALKLEANYAHQNTEDSISGEQIALVPQSMAYVGIYYDISDNWSIGSTSHWIGNRDRAASDSRDSIDDYLVSNISTSYKFNENYSGKVSIKNLFDEDIFEPSTGSISNDYKMPGRNIWLELEYLLYDN